MSSYVRAISSASPCGPFDWIGNVTALRDETTLTCASEPPCVGRLAALEDQPPKPELQICFTHGR